MKKLIKFLTGRLAITFFFILFQLVLLSIVSIYFSRSFIYYYYVMVAISLVLVVVIINDDTNPTFKMAWMVPMLILPTLGAPLYIVLGRHRVSKRIIKKFHETNIASRELLVLNSDTCREIKQHDPAIFKQFLYVYNTSGCPVYKNTQTNFYPSGEEFFSSLLKHLEKAEKFIYLEFFIIDKGRMWSSVLDILKRKADDGLDVRLLYDDFGTIQNLDRSYPKHLASFGIKTAIFNPFRASLDVFLNYRDHRKIVVIDGKVGYTGGINLADEYINYIDRFGHWKDSAIMIKGEAVTNLTAMFIQLWNFSSNSSEQLAEPDFCNYGFESDGFVQPFSDSPIDDHLTSELAYINMINSAKEYVYITTPYLILDNEMITALKLARDCDIDVRIITPHIPDKWYVHSVTRANYPTLLKSGIRIFEYTPGFIHSKTIVVDDELAIVGTANFDFRSFYLHFENGILMYKSKAVMQVKEEYTKTLEKCTEITLDSYLKESAFSRFKGNVLKLFSPMM